MIRRKPPQLAARPDRSDEFASVVLERPRAVMSTLARPDKPVPTSLVKTPDRVSQRIRDSARGESCTVRIVGVCSFDPEKTIWSHAPLGAGGKGRSIKALDLCGAYACTSCDAVVDMQAPMPPGMDRAAVLIDWMYGHMRSLVRLRQKGLA